MRSIALAAVLCVTAVPAWAAEPSYDAFRTGPIYQGPLSKPVLSTGEARTYRTRLLEGARSRPNFASRYHLTIWGCGTSCTMGAATDASSGRVVFVPFSICCYAGPMDAPDWQSMQFHNDSSLIVFHGQRNEEGVNGDHYYSFDGNVFRFIATKEMGSSGDLPTVTGPAPAPAQTSELQTCQKIADNDGRLKCYDAVTNYQK